MGLENVMEVLICAAAVAAAFGEGYRLGKARGGCCVQSGERALRQSVAGGVFHSMKQVVGRAGGEEQSEAARTLEKDMRNIDNYRTAVAQEEAERI